MLSLEERINRAHDRKRINKELSLKRKEALIKRTPKWSQEVDILEFYENRPEGMHVDHVLPLQGKYVSGLHVIENLQYLEPRTNYGKRNHWRPE